jgi:hypothetical protein
VVHGAKSKAVGVEIKQELDAVPLITASSRPGKRKLDRVEYGV